MHRKSKIKIYDTGIRKIKNRIYMDSACLAIEGEDKDLFVIAEDKSEMAIILPHQAIRLPKKALKEIVEIYKVYYA